MSIDSEVLSVMYEHCTRAYDLMKVEAKPEPGSKKGYMVWEGFMTHLINDQMKMSTPYYSSILNHLKRMGCIQQLRRGGSSTPSQWLLITSPTPELFRHSTEKTSRSAIKLDGMEQRIVDLTRRVSTLETLLRNGITVTVEGVDDV